MRAENSKKKEERALMRLMSAREQQKEGRVGTHEVNECPRTAKRRKNGHSCGE
jgi:hypothetical protein